MRRIWHHSLLVLLLCHCAVQRPPGGGPEDTQPPAIQSMQPAENAVAVDVMTDISCEFDEQMNRISVLRALTITPPFQQEPKYDWKGATLRIIPSEPLQQNRTYVVTIGTDATDLRNNRLPASITWAFSTGERVDKGALAGRVFGAEELIATWVSAFAVTDNEFVDFGMDEPVYQSQTDEEGRFLLEYIADGRYRIVAWRDQNHDLKFTPRSDPLALPPWDIEFTQDQSNHQPLLFMLASRDTLPPVGRRIVDTAPLGLALRFDKPIHASSADWLTWNVHDAAGSRVDASQWQCQYRSEQPDVLTLFADAPLASGDYTLTISNAANVRGIRSSTQFDTLDFRIPAEVPEDLPAVSKTSPASDSRTASPAEIITVNFNSLMRPVDNLPIGTLLDSTGAPVSADWRWPDGETVHIIPHEWLIAANTYSVQIDSARLQDWFGRALADTLTRWDFTVAEQDFGIVAGRVTDAGHHGSAPLVLQLREPETARVLNELQLTQPGEFTFSNVIAGSYQLVAFYDEDQDGQISTGAIAPYRPAELFVIAESLIDVRAGWDVEDVQVEFPY